MTKAVQSLSGMKYVVRNGVKFYLKGRVKRDTVNRIPLRELMGMRLIDSASDDRISRCGERDMVLGGSNQLDSSSEIRLQACINSIEDPTSLETVISELQKMSVRFLQLDGKEYRVLEINDVAIKQQIEKYMNRARERKSGRERKPTQKFEFSLDENNTRKQGFSKNKISKPPTQVNSKKSQSATSSKNHPRPTKSNEKKHKKRRKSQKETYDPLSIDPEGLLMNSDIENLPQARNEDFEEGITVLDPAPSDIMCGRGQHNKCLQGGNLFRSVIRQCRDAYSTCKREEKRKIALYVLWKVNTAKPRPRYLLQHEDCYVSVGFSTVIFKATQALREKKWSSNPSTMMGCVGGLHVDAEVHT